MRLIDTDKLIVEVVRSGNIVCLPHFSLEQINTAPVVEAIPIEWIEEWGWKNGMSESMSLAVMIEDWRKENE